MSQCLGESVKHKRNDLSLFCTVFCTQGTVFGARHTVNPILRLSLPLFLSPGSTKASFGHSYLILFIPLFRRKLLIERRQMTGKLFGENWKFANLFSLELFLLLINLYLGISPKCSQNIGCILWQQSSLLGFQLPAVGGEWVDWVHKFTSRVVRKVEGDG